MAVKIYTMSQRQLSSRKTKGGRLNCYTCDIPFKVGDLVVSKKCTNHRQQIRHEECARKVGIID